jgi:hypothetical protein
VSIRLTVFESGLTASITVPSLVMAIELLDLLTRIPGAFPAAVKVAGVPVRMTVKRKSNRIVPDSRTKYTTVYSMIKPLL